MTTTSDPEISLIMATVTRVTEPERFVSSLATQTRKGFELIIVDQNNDERLQSVIKKAVEAAVPVIHLRHAERNLSSARNMGIQAARAPLIAFPDDDCWYEPRTIENALAYFERHPETQVAVASWPEATREVIGHGEISWEKNLAFRGTLASSIMIFARKELLIRAGGFDSRLGVPNWFGAGEEFDLMINLLQQGACVNSVPEVVVHHTLVSNPRQRLSEMFRDVRRRSRGVGAMFAKHPVPRYVIARGIVGPLFRALANALSLREAVKQLAMATGRIEGMLRWRRVYGQGRCSSYPSAR